VAKQPRSLSGRVATISGGARGIGRATAAALVAAGATVAIGDLDGAEQAARELGAGVVGLPLDVTSSESFSSFLDQAESRLGPVDIFINNAGVLSVGPFERERDLLTERMLEVNILGTLIGCKLAVQRLTTRNTGHLVNVASAAGKVGLAGGVTYSATKHAIVGLSEALRAELAGTKIEVHVVLPTPVATDMSLGQPRLRGVRRLKPEEVAAAIVDGLREGRPDIYVPRSIGPLLRSSQLLPHRLTDRITHLVGGDRVLAAADPLERAAYEARILPPAADPAANVASAAASVANAVRDN